MTEQDRGAYTPQTDAPLAFDARLASGGRSQAPMTLIVSGLVLAVLALAMVMFYRSGVRGSNQPPQVVGAPVADAKTAAPPSAQPSQAPAGLQIYQAEGAAQGDAKVAAPAFVAPPEDSALRPAPPAPASGPTAALPAAAPAEPSAPPPAPPPAQSVHLRAAEAPAAVEAATTPPPTAAPRASAKPAIKKSAQARAKPAASAPGQGNRVQIGAFSSQAVADQGFRDTAKLLPGPMNGRTKAVEPFTKDGELFYRAFVGGFSSHAEAQAFCASLKAAGKSCFVR